MKRPLGLLSDLPKTTLNRRELRVSSYSMTSDTLIGIISLHVEKRPTKRKRTGIPSRAHRFNGPSQAPPRVEEINSEFIQS